MRNAIRLLGRCPACDKEDGLVAIPDYLTPARERQNKIRCENCGETWKEEYWFFERRRRDLSTAVWVLEGVIGRPISRVEALRIVRQTLEQAERERIEMAAFEAARGIQWEDEA